MEASSEDQLTSEEWKNIQQLVSTVKTGYAQILNDPNQEAVVQEALLTLWNLSDDNRYKGPLLHPSLQFLPILKTILLDQHYPTLVAHSLGCVWYLSRKEQNNPLIASPDLGLLPILMQYLTQHGDDRAYKILRNCFFHPENHRYMLSDEIGYVEYWKNEMLQRPLIIDPYHAFAALGSTFHDDIVYQLAKWRIPDLIFQRLVSFGVNPTSWLGRRNGIEDLALTFLMSLSTTLSGRKILMNLNPFPFLSMVSRTPSWESIRCLVILYNLYGKDITPTLTKNFHLNTPLYLTQHLCNSITQEVYQYFTNVLVATIYENDCVEAQLLHLRGYNYGTFKLRDLTLFYLHLTLLYPDIRHYMIQDNDLIGCFMIIIDRFTQNGPEFAANNHVGKISGGGGKDDQNTMENVLELFIQLLNVYWELDIEGSSSDKKRVRMRDSIHWFLVLNKTTLKPAIQRFLKQFEILRTLSDIKNVDMDRPLTPRLKQLLDLCLSLTHQIIEEEKVRKESLPNPLRAKLNFTNELNRFWKPTEN